MKTKFRWFSKRPILHRDIVVYDLQSEMSSNLFCFWDFPFSVGRALITLINSSASLFLSNQGLAWFTVFSLQTCSFIMLSKCLRVSPIKRCLLYYFYLYKHCNWVLKWFSIFSSQKECFPIDYPNLSLMFSSLTRLT